MNRYKPGERYRYKLFTKGKDRHLFNTEPRELRYIVGNKFMLRGDDVKTEREPDEKGPSEVMTVKHLANYHLNRLVRQICPITEREVPYEPIRWKGLLDKNRDNLYAIDQLLPQSKFKGEDEKQFLERKSKYVKLFEQARQAIMSDN